MTTYFSVSVRPLWVKITSEKKPLSADNPYELSCEVVGSRPEPVITWWLGSVQLKDTRETVSINVTPQENKFNQKGIHFVNQLRFL